MNMLSFVTTIIFSIPEAIAIIWLAYGLLGVKPSWKKILQLAVLTGVIVFFIRPLAGNYIANVLTYNIILVVLLSFNKIGKLFDRIIGVAFSTSLYLVVEFINVKILSMIFDNNLERLLESFVSRFAIFLPQLLIALALAYTIDRYQLVLFANPKEKNEQGL